MQDAISIVACRADRVAGSVDAIGRVVQHIAVEVDLDQVGRRDLVIYRPVGVDQDLVILARDPRRDMVEVEVVPAVMEHQPVTGGEIDAHLPFFG